ncbi:MAG: aldehyde dehydrogenase [Bacteroidales bacterium]|nr:aldehyde dehydrogenase [Bacteroidales bacterium]
MEKDEIQVILEKQRKFFDSGKTLDIKYRLENLRKLRTLILQHEEEIIEAIGKDFHKPRLETIGTETRLVVSELNHFIKNLRRWSSGKRVLTPLMHFPASSYIIPQPYGQVLVMSPWNFPFLLSMIPVIGALAAGNCVILKVSRKASNAMHIISRILGSLPGEHVSMVPGDHTTSDMLLDHKFDYIFFTGSTEVGKKVMKKAAENLIPITLELGGKSPCVVAADASLELAAKRIAWGKFINAGQTCIAPDYLLVDNHVRDRFMELIVNEVNSFYGKNPEESPDYCRIINSSKAGRLESFMKKGRIVTGGQTNREKCYVAPTIITDIRPDDPVMSEEIFGPVLPVISFDDFMEVYEIIGRNPKPLAAYIFTRTGKLAREFLSKTQSGTAAINDTVMQIASSRLPFGGIGPSGLGRYHGRKSFETFSNMRSVLKKSNLLELPVKYPPYTKLKERIIKLVLR